MHHNDGLCGVLLIMSADFSGKISLALGGSRKPAKPAATNGVKRPHAALQDHEGEDHEHGKTQSVSHFDKAAGGAIDEKKPVKETGPLVIKPQANRDWKEAGQRNKKQRVGKVGEDGGLRNGPGGNTEQLEREEAASKSTYGLDVRKRSQDEEAPEMNVDATAEDAEPNGGDDAPVKPKTADEQAMDALLGKTKDSGLVLPAMTEEEAFDRDYKTAPDQSTLEDYARVPVEEFGAALLRGMGWKDGEGIGLNRGRKVEKTKIPERRPALLGIGAKEEAAVAQELGTWGKAAKDRKGGGAVQVYNPVLLRDKRTGEMFTEEELEKKKAREERERYEVDFERKEKEGRRREKDRDGERQRDSERSRDKGSRRERRNSRDRRKHDDSDEEYYRRKEKEKRRRERDDSDRDRDRSRRHESERNGHRDRHQDRRR
ncbi:DNA primase large subunit Spp2 [Vermiconidia calcicola]|uniref:DNA primase large subunit Spp2 n=1 Tax=Vermiconidia calcicola TaxID=1690605 RepID=A0ACC3NKB4_9PEZI|nr:DNA primase large subunit Spp2 [Vermiconidia calcicola]